MAVIELWKNKDKRVVDPYLFSVTANDLAVKIDADGRDNRGHEKQNSSTQLRRFFDEVTRLNIKARDEVEPWELIMPQVHMMVAKAAYAKGRGLVSKSFVELFGDTIREQVKDKDDLQAFTGFFESFIGFYKSYRKN